MPRYIDAEKIVLRYEYGFNDNGLILVPMRDVRFSIEQTPTADVVEITEDFETMLICAERYACGRQSYMPLLVVDYITPLLPKLSNRTLAVMERDIAEAGRWGDETIDKPLWMQFLADVRAAIAERGKK